MKAFKRAGFEVKAERRAHFILDGQSEGLVLVARWLEAIPARQSS